MDESRRCTARSKQSGERCKRYVTPGMKVCKFHGGKSLRGPAHPSWKHGGTSRYVPERYAEALHATLNDPRALELRHSLGIIRARMDELLQQAEEANTREVFRRLADNRIEALALLDRAQRHNREAVRLEAEGDAAGAAREREASAAAGRQHQEVYRALLDDIERGGQFHDAFDDLLRLIQTETKVTESERRRLESERAYATLAQVEGLFARFAVEAREAVTRNVDDKTVRAAILSEMLLRMKALYSELSQRALPVGEE